MCGLLIHHFDGDILQCINLIHGNMTLLLMAPLVGKKDMF